MSNPQKPATAQQKEIPANTAANESADQFDISESSYKTGHAAIRKARRFAMQGLYEWLMTDRRFEQEGQREWKANPPHDIAARTRATNAMHTVHLGYYHEMMRDIPEQIDELDALIAAHLDRDISLLDPIEHAILLIGTYELKDHLEVPYKVVLDEAMKLNTHFGATDAHKLINAVLDKLAPQLREVEVAADAEHPKITKKTKAKPAAANSNITNNNEEDSINDSNDTVANEYIAENTADTTATKQLPKAEPKPRISLKSGQPTRKRAATPTESAPPVEIDADEESVAKQKIETPTDND